MDSDTVVYSLLVSLHPNKYQYFSTTFHRDLVHPREIVTALETKLLTGKGIRKGHGAISDISSRKIDFAQIGHACVVTVN